MKARYIFGFKGNETLHPSLRTTTRRKQEASLAFSCLPFPVRPGTENFQEQNPVLGGTEAIPSTSMSTFLLLFSLSRAGAENDLSSLGARQGLLLHLGGFKLRKRQLDLLPHLRVVRVAKTKRLRLPLPSRLQRMVLQEGESGHHALCGSPEHMASAAASSSSRSRSKEQHRFSQVPSSQLSTACVGVMPCSYLVEMQQLAIPWFKLCAFHGASHAAVDKYHRLLREYACYLAQTQAHPSQALYVSQYQRDVQLLAALSAIVPSKSGRGVGCVWVP